MKDNIKTTVMVLVTVILVSVIFAFAIKQPAEKSILTSEGSGEVEVVPDLLEINLLVQTKNLTSEEATNSNSLITSLVIDALKEMGIPEDNIQTSNFNVYQDYDYSSSGRKENGYIASHNLVIDMSVDELDKINEVIGKATSVGATVSYLNYKLSRSLEDEMKKESYKMASEDAHNKAKNIAEGLGAKLGKIKQITLLDSFYPYHDYGVLRAEASDIDSQKISVTRPVAQTVSTRISVVYEIK